MIRDGRVVYEESFVVKRGEDRVLTAWDDPSRRPDEQPIDTPAL